MSDGGETYAGNQDLLYMNEYVSISAWMLGLAQIPFILNVILTLIKKKQGEVGPNPWDGTTMEWACPSPPIPHGNFEEDPVAYRGPYEYSVPGQDKDFTPQFEKPGEK